MEILIAEDSFTERLILQKIVEGLGHTTRVAENGQQAVQMFAESMPDAVLLDALMPVMDGFDAAERIRELKGPLYIPIIFITSLKETEELARCFEVGADDFFTKPFSKVILEKKLSSYQRTQQLYREVEQQRDKIKADARNLRHEQHVARRIFDNVVRSKGLEQPNIRHHVSPMSIFNGDILIAVPRPLGGLNIFLGDFTGHGLPAAIGAIPASQVFIGMSEKGFDVYEILHEINRKLKQILPTGFFCCAAAVQIDYSENTLQFWNGGLPSSYLANHQTGQLQPLESKHLPLGILDESEFKTNMERVSFSATDSLLVYSDGVTEAENAAGEMFGESRVLKALEQGVQSTSCFDSLQTVIDEFLGDADQADDMTYLEVTGDFEPEQMMPQDLIRSINTKGPSDSEFSLHLGPHSLRQFNPLPVLSQHIVEIGQLRVHRTQILTILTELYSNALEHGVLQLSSELKRNPEGFAEYYMLREQRLKDLAEGHVVIRMVHQPTEQGGRLSIFVDDSGEGFDHQSARNEAKLEGLSGRGVPLIKSLADSVEYRNNGASVKVDYVWSIAT